MQLPTELLDQVLLECVATGDRAACRDMRLTCRLFDRVLKPHVCRTVSLSFRHINRSGTRPRAQVDALDTVGDAAKVLNIDMSAVRDPMEIEMLDRTPSLRRAMRQQGPNFLSSMERAFRNHCLGSDTCSEKEYYQLVYDTLDLCNNIHTLRLVLPNPFVPIPCDAPTYVLMNTIAAFADIAEDYRSEETDPVIIAETLIIENLTRYILTQLSKNPIDINKHQIAFSNTKNLVLALRDPDLSEETEPFYSVHSVHTDAENFWRFISPAAKTLESICIARADHSPRSRPRPPVTKPSVALQRPRSWDMSLPPRHDVVNYVSEYLWPNLTRLELKGVTIEAGGFLKYAINAAGPTLRELYLDAVDMEVGPTETSNLWIGVPNRRPHSVPPQLQGAFNPQTDRHPEWWAAALVRDGCPCLEIVRATDLCYVSFTDEWESHDPDSDPGFDTRDPSGLGRTIAQRFVEIVLGYKQPDAPPNWDAAHPPNGLDLDLGGPRDTIDPIFGGHVRYLPYVPADDEAYFANLRPRPPGVLRAEDHDLAAYRLAGGANTTSPWLRSVDGTFPNVPAATDDPTADAWIDDRLEGLLRERRAGDPVGDYLTSYQTAQMIARLSTPTSDELDDIMERLAQAHRENPGSELEGQDFYAHPYTGHYITD